MAAVEVNTGREVLAFLSDHHIDPDIAVEVFILKPRGERRRVALSRCASAPAPTARHAADRSGLAV